MLLKWLEYIIIIVGVSVSDKNHEEYMAMLQADVQSFHCIRD